ncbi:MAG TPA: DUF2231 domain-containing protein [Anaeromyxobacter sp.]
MLDAPLHPALVHVPLGLSFVVPLVAIGISIAFWRDRLPRSAFAILAALQLVLAGSGLAAMAAGDRDQRRVEKVVGRKVVHDHEERGEAFVWAAFAVAALATALLLVPGRVLGGAAALTIAGTVAVAALAFATGKAGGEIVYRHGGAAAYSTHTKVAVPAGGGLRQDHD